MDVDPEHPFEYVIREGSETERTAYLIVESSVTGARLLHRCFIDDEPEPQ